MRQRGSEIERTEKISIRTQRDKGKKKDGGRESVRTKEEEMVFFSEAG